jgi:hypothetical protein
MLLSRNKVLIHTLFNLLLIFLITVSVSKAQSIVRENNEYRTGSIYSFSALGSPVDLRNANSAGMGLSGVAIYNGVVANYANPAVWSRTYITLANGSLRLQRTMAEDLNSNATSALLDALNFQLIVPIYKNKLGVSASLTPLTRKSYSYFSTGNIPANEIGTFNDLIYLSDNKGEGGLSRVELGAGYSLTDHISIGYSASVVMGLFESSTVTSFSNPIYRPLTYEFNERQFGIGHRFGLYGFTNDLLFDKDFLSLGLNLELPVNLTSIGNDRVENRETNLDVAGRSGDGKIYLPMKVEVGFLYQKNPALGFSAELLHQPWSQYETRTGVPNNYLVDRNRIAAGLQWLPSLATRRTNFLSNMQYRIGLSRDSGYLNINDTNIDGVAAHIGVSIPAQNSRSSIDIAFEYGRRGTTQAGLVNERYWTLKMSFNLAELMFFDRRFQ